SCTGCNVIVTRFVDCASSHHAALDRKHNLGNKYMTKLSAGLLMFRRGGADLQVFLVHPGGPFWKKKDQGAWSIPKGEYDNGEDPLDGGKERVRRGNGIQAGRRIHS